MKSLRPPHRSDILPIETETSALAAELAAMTNPIVHSPRLGSITSAVNTDAMNAETRPCPASVNTHTRTHTKSHRIRLLVGLAG